MKPVFGIFAFVMLTTLTTAAAAPAKPNIVIILADDMGYSDAGCYGGEIATPHIDALAGHGLRFTRFYNTARCWSSRACLLTGYYAQEVRRDTLPGIGGGARGVRPGWAELLPAMLKPVGYRTYHSGKWHVDGPVLAGGFDHSYWVEDYDHFFNPSKHFLDDQPLPKVQLGSNYYNATAVADHAIQMLANHTVSYSNQPFFLYLAFLSPHFPLQAPPSDIALYTNRYTNGWDTLRDERFHRMQKLGIVDCPLSAPMPDVIPSWNLSEEKLKRQIGPGEVGHAVPWETLTAEEKQFQPIKMSIHAAMVHRMDTEIGRVIEQLRAMNALDNTLILFMSDNGASAEQIIRGSRNDKSAAPGSAGSFLCAGPGWSTAANTPFRYHKSWVHEGGISTPLIVQWPDGISARGEMRENVGHLIDIVPTVLEVAGATRPTNVSGLMPPPPPGKSLVPVFTRDNSVNHDYFWWLHDGNRAIRVGDWKLVADHEKPFELYDLKTDRSEMHNLAASHPDKVKEMEELWQRHTHEFETIAKEGLPAGKPGKEAANPAD